MSSNGPGRLVPRRQVPCDSRRTDVGVKGLRCLIQAGGRCDCERIAVKLLETPPVTEDRVGRCDIVAGITGSEPKESVVGILHLVGERYLEDGWHRKPKQ